MTPPACLAGLIVQEPEGLTLSVPYKDNTELYDVLDEWQSEACPHDDMTAALESVGNWASYRAFQHAVAGQGFPVLNDVLPNGNGGIVEAAEAAAALDELRRFARHSDFGEEAVLCDAVTGAVVWQQIRAFGGANVMSAEAEMGVDLDGFFVRRGDVEVFRAVRFSQEVVDGGQVRFSDGPVAVTLPVKPVAGQAGVPGDLVVRSRLVGAGSFTPVVGALVRLFEASVETGNPVVWC
ncbi:hypothetical protein Lesp02_24270 [Lentzea sp. NBRC 105346]|nr:hypothetical protein Lesp02_24270 [Lentzea sp. NBRC 105346]